MTTRVDQLSAATSIATTDLLVVEQGGVLKQATPILLPFAPSGTGAMTSTVSAKLSDENSATNFSLTNLFANTVGLLTIPYDAYSVASNITPAAMDLALRIDPAATFTGAGLLKMDSQIPFQSTPVLSLDLVRKTIDSNYSGYGNVFLRAAYIKSTVATVPCVAVFGGAESTAASGKSWGGNFVSYARSSSATAIGAEINCGADTAGGVAYGLVIAAANTQPCTAAIQIQANASAAQFTNGINFDWDATDGCVTGSIIRLAGVGSATAAYFIRATDITFSSAEIDLPSFSVEATPASVTNNIHVTAAAASGSPVLKFRGGDTNVNGSITCQGNGVLVFTNNSKEQFRIQSTSADDSLQVVAGTGGGTLSVRGSSTNADVNVTGKGSGGVRLRDGGSTERFRVNTTGIGFFATAPAAQQTSGANLTNNITSGGTDDTLTNWTDLSTYSTDAAAIRNAVYQLGRKLKQINDGLRTYGMFT